VVSLELVYYFAGGALIVGLLFGIVLGFALSGGRGGEPAGAPPPPRTETGVAMIREPDGTWRIEVGKQRYRHLRRSTITARPCSSSRRCKPCRPCSGNPPPRCRRSPVYRVLRLQSSWTVSSRNSSGNTPELPYRAVRLETLPDGTMGILIGTQRYQRVGDVPDPELRALLQEAIQRWLQGKSPPVSRPVRAGHAGAHHR
jgi:hypothetical protein